MLEGMRHDAQKHFSERDWSMTFRVGPIQLESTARGCQTMYVMLEGMRHDAQKRTGV